MTVHMTRLFIEPPKGNVEQAIDNWVQNHTEWNNDPTEHILQEVTTDLDGDGTAYLSGDYRFIQEEPASDLLDGLESRLGSVQGGLWYRIGYHACTHDEDAPTPCAWEETRENGSIPEDISTLDNT